MNLKHVVGIFGRSVQHHIPTILGLAATAGVVATAVLSIKATPKAMALIEEHKKKRAEEVGVDTDSIQILPKDAVKIAWRPYIPAILMGGATIMSIVGANTIYMRRSAAVLGAYSLTDRAFTEYRNQVKELFGEHEQEKVQDKVAETLVREDAPKNDIVLYPDDDLILCYDSMSGRYFKSTVETIRKAQNDVNEIILNDMYASMNDFYERIDLQRTELGEIMGWNLNNLMDLSFSSTLTESNQPCLAILYTVYPVENYYVLNS